MINLLYTCYLILTTSIYSHEYTNIDGGSQSMHAYRGKKIMLVNIATGSSRVSQLNQLQQLYTQYSDSLVIIGFPSNSFGHEPRENGAIKDFCRNQYGVTFPLAVKNPISGPDAQPIYKWTTTFLENGMIEGQVRSDFQKFLIDRDGKLIGAFSGSVDPLDQIVITAIQEN